MSCEPWCEYYPAWEEGYDVVIVRSAHECLKQAVNLRDPGKLGQVMPALDAKCLNEGSLGEAAKLNFTAGVKAMLDFDANPSATVSDETALQAAAVRRSVSSSGVQVHERAARVSTADLIGSSMFEVLPVCCEQTRVLCDFHAIQDGLL